MYFKWYIVKIKFKKYYSFKIVYVILIKYLLIYIQFKINKHKIFKIKMSFNLTS